jgi:hypothetical protein
MKQNLFLVYGIIFLFICAGLSGCIDSPSKYVEYVEVKWSKTFGGNDEELGSFVLYTEDGGCIATGRTKSFGSGLADLWLVKVDQNGIEEWNKTFGGTGWEDGKAIEQLDDESYVIVGKTSSFGYGNTDIWLIKVDQNGIEEWNKTFGGTGWEEGNSIKETDDGGYILIGDTTSFGVGEFDIWLIKVNQTGDEQWNKTFGGIKDESGRSIEKTDDSGYIIAAETENFGAGDYDIWLIKVNQTGDEQWNKTIGSEDSDQCNEIIKTDDGGFIIAGHNIETETSKFNGILVKIDGDGTVQWETLVVEKGAAGTSSVDTIEDGYIAVGYSGEYGPEQNLLIAKIDSLGNVVWNRSIGGDYLDAGIWIEKGGGKHYFVTGYKDEDGNGVNDLWLLKIKIN